MMAFHLGEVARIRGQLVSACARKIRHATFREADAHIADVLFHKGKDERTLFVYRCPHCRLWHVGSRRVVGER